MSTTPEHATTFPANLAVTTGETAPLDIGEPTWTEEQRFKGPSGPRSRVRLTGHLALGGDRPHLISVSEPDPSLVGAGTAAPLRVIFPGWTEAADGFTRHLHDAAAADRPGSRTLTIATDGVSINGPALPYRAAVTRTFTEMARDRLAIISHFAAGGAVTFLGRSMGAVLAMRTAELHLQASPGTLFPLAELQLLSPGVIAADVPEEVTFRSPLDTMPQRLKMFVEFLGHVGADVVRESARHPVEAVKAGRTIVALAAACGHDTRKAAAIGGNLLQLWAGIPWKSIVSVAANYPISVLTGSKDTVREVEQWQTLQGMYPHNVRLRVLGGKGHIMSLDAIRTVGHLAA
ncbi:MAG TPA: hypothetical protein VLF69_02490 [Candidatus Saccharimonadales bacterium]|nr:hypothetical protein [Candidatus Saccharimonadales bacterium]